MKSPAKILRIVLVLVALGGLAWLARGFQRYLSVRMVLNSPEHLAAAKAMPSRMTPHAETNGRTVNLGYAKFTAGKGMEPVSVNLDNSMDYFLLVACGDSRFTIRHPYGIVEMKDYELKEWKRLSGYPRAADSYKRSFSDRMAFLMEAEEVRPLGFSTLCKMPAEDFELYRMKLAAKVMANGRRDEIYLFQTPYIKGLVRFGPDPTSPDPTVSILLSSPDGKINLSFWIMVPGGTKEDLRKMVEQTLGTFEFTPAEFVSNEEILRLIHGAGIVKGKLDNWRDEVKKPAP